MKTVQITRVWAGLTPGAKAWCLADDRVYGRPDWMAAWPRKDARPIPEPDISTGAVASFRLRHPEVQTGPRTVRHLAWLEITFGPDDTR